MPSYLGTQKFVLAEGSVVVVSVIATERKRANTPEIIVKQAR